MHLYTLYIVHTLYTLNTSYSTHAREEENSPSQKREKGKLAKTKSEGGKGGQHLLRTNSTMQPDRAHARTNEKKRNDFPIGLTPPQSRQPLENNGLFSRHVEIESLTIKMQQEFQNLRG